MKLTLARETLVELTTDELVSVVGGAVTDTCLDKITEKYFHSYRCTR